MKEYSPKTNAFIKKWAKMTWQVTSIVLVTLFFALPNLGREIFNRPEEMGVVEYIFFLGFSLTISIGIIVLSAWIAISILSFLIFFLSYASDHSYVFRIKELKELKEKMIGSQGEKEVTAAIRHGFWVLFLIPGALIGILLLILLLYSIFPLTALLLAEYGLNTSETIRYGLVNIWPIVLFTIPILGFSWFIFDSKGIEAIGVIFMIIGLVLLAPNITKLAYQSDNYDKIDQLIMSVKSIFALILISSSIIIFALPNKENNSSEN
jgi:hypothetical protein